MNGRDLHVQVQRMPGVTEDTAGEMGCGGKEVGGERERGKMACSSKLEMKPKSN